MSQPVRVTDLRRRNRAQVLRMIAIRGDVTRAELASELDLSLGTVANVVSELLAEGLVYEAGSLPSNGGRPTARLRVRSESAYFIGADVGEHGVEAALFDLNLDSVDAVFVPLTFGSTTAEKVRDVVAESLNHLIDQHADLEPRLKGVGLGLPGIVETEPDGTTTIHAQSLGWSPLPLTDLSPRLPVPVLADNGAKTFAAAEQWSGAARGVGHSVVALLGRGVGAGIISGGRLLRGASSSAGEWGHTKIELNGRRCSCGGRGCLEAYVGGSAIRHRATEAGLTEVGTDQQALAALLAGAADGAEPHRTLVAETVEYLAIGLANLVNLFNPQQMVIGGWAGHLLFSSFQEDIRSAVRRHALRRPGEQITLVGSKGSVDPIALGAALLPLEQFIDGTIPGGQA